MTLIQRLGKKELLILNTKTHSLHTTNNFLWAHFMIEIAQILYSYASQRIKLISRKEPISVYLILFCCEQPYSVT